MDKKKTKKEVVKKAAKPASKKIETKPAKKAVSAKPKAPAPKAAKKVSKPAESKPPRPPVIEVAPQPETVVAAAEPRAETAPVVKVYSGPTIRLQWIRSAIGFPKKQKLIVRGLGFRRLRETIVRPDTPMIRGMVRRIPHLVEIVG